eukprot:TRINITY_DN15560_c0_g1_i1.p1 TRINITY_DN15560_c0_g1~~TRINITY_DN15560_c0_g1_i1.p1  ORF type:complete len:947 (-),score=290.46 TRINITY_DN15560_c0_g1_i1:97-2853(-)
MAEKGVNIQVVARCRPTNASERLGGSKQIVQIDKADHTVAIESHQTGKVFQKTFTFDESFGPETTQEELYFATVSPIVEEVLKGFNCTIFAYGQTGTGKTYTMEGSRLRDETGKCDVHAGVIPRAIAQIFENIAEQQRDASVKVSMMELYNEELIDLLANEKIPLKIFDNGDKGVTVSPLEECAVISAESIYKVLDTAIEKRHVAETQLNAHSSRSHCIFSITIHIKETTPEGEDLIKIGKLNLVDLAGSENIGRSGATEKRATEAGNINKSLLTLGRVITELVQRSTHVPYRESKLTRLLQDSLGGRTKTCLIATISPAANCLEETLSTLDYAFRAKKIKNKPQVNQMLTKRAMIREYTEQIQRLKLELTATREKNGIYLPAERFNSMQDEITNSKTAIGELEASLLQTRRDLEEKLHLLDYYKIHGKKLKTKATLLKDTLESTFQDVSNLHGKIDRKISVEEENKTRVQQFMMYLTNRVAEAEKRLTQFTEQQKSAFEALRANVQSFQLAKATEIASIGSKVDLILSNTQQSRDAAIAAADAFSAQTASFTTEAVAAEESNARTVNDQAIAIQRTAESGVASLQQLLTLQTAEVTAWASGSTESINAFDSDVQSFSNAQTAALAEVRESADQATNFALEQFAQQQDALEAFAKQQQEQMAQAQAALVQQMQTMMEQFVQQQQTSMTTAVQSMQQSLSTGVSRLAAMQVETQQKTEAATVNTGVFAKQFSESATAKNSEFAATAAKCSSFIETSQQQSVALQTGIQTAAAAVQESASAFSAASVALLNSNSTAVDSFIGAEKSQWASNASSVEQNHTALCSALENVLASDNVAVTEWSKEFDARQASEAQVAEDFRSTVQLLQDETRGFFSKMKVDEPTGATPVKKTFVMPDAIASPLADSSILMTMRRPMTAGSAI